MPKQTRPISGWINLSKPLGMSSAQAVGKVKWLLKPAKIGHAGTLDPLATGVLPLALGEGTKCVNLLMDAKKTYEFSVTFGEERSTADAEGEVTATSDARPTPEQIEAVLPRFMGRITQVPPIYSALKIDGKRAYELARAGEVVEMKSREVTIHALEFLGIEGAVGQFRATVSKGTYIRSLGIDIARAAGALGFISRLHRAAVGPFSDKDAISLDFLEKTAHNAAPTGDSPWLLPLRVALDDIPAISLTAQQATTLRHGQHPLVDLPDTALAAAFEGEAMLGLVRVEGQKVIAQRLLNTSPDVAKEVP